MRQVGWFPGPSLPRILPGARPFVGEGEPDGMPPGAFGPPGGVGQMVQARGLVGLMMGLPRGASGGGLQPSLQTHVQPGCRPPAPGGWGLTRSAFPGGKTATAWERARGERPGPGYPCTRVLIRAASRYASRILSTRSGFVSHKARASWKTRERILSRSPASATTRLSQNSPAGRGRPPPGPSPRAIPGA